MGYQTLYRKYRPKSFEDIVGQENIVRILSNAVIHSKIAHAYLFCGPRGTGKTSMAKIFAKIVNCDNLQNSVEPCNKCDSCLQIENKNFLDIIEIDAASNNGVDEIRELKNKINLAPNNGKYKVYIIDEVHMLSIGAFNALLKTLEEPPAHIIFILATTEPHKLPITVISRCQRFDFKKFTNIQISDNLMKICKKENLIISNDVLNEIAVLSDGGMRDAIGLLDQLSVYEQNSISIDDLYQISGSLSMNIKIDFLEHYFDNDIIYCINLLYRFESDGKNFSKIVDDLLYLLEKILKYKVIKEYNDSEDINYKNDYIQIANKAEKEKLCNLITKLTNILKDIKNTSNPRLLIEMIFLMEFDSSNESSLNISASIPDKEKIIVKENESSKQVNGISKFPNDKKTCKDNCESLYKKFLLSEDQYTELKKVRINNSFATAEKELLNNYKNIVPLILEHMFDENYSSVICNMQDSELRVAGISNLIFSVDSEMLSNSLNEQIYLIDELFAKVFNKKIKSIFVSIEEWCNIKKAYVNSIKTGNKYELLEEINYFDIKPSNLKKIENSDLEGIFGSNIDDIIEVR